MTITFADLLKLLSEARPGEPTPPGEGLYVEFSPFASGQLGGSVDYNTTTGKRLVLDLDEEGAVLGLELV